MLRTRFNLDEEEESEIISEEGYTHTWNQTFSSPIRIDCWTSKNQQDLLELGET